MTDTYVPTMKIVNDLLTELKIAERVRVKQTGSITVFGSIEDGAKDDDVIIWAPTDELADLIDEKLEAMEYTDAEEYANVQAVFIAYRSPNDLNNVLVTKDLVYFNKYCLATDVVADLQLYNKPQRIMVFSAIVEGQWADPHNDMAAPRLAGRAFPPPPAFPVGNEWAAFAPAAPVDLAFDGMINRIAEIREQQALMGDAIFAQNAAWVRGV